MALARRVLVLVFVLFLTAGFAFAEGAQEEPDPDEPVTIDYGFWGNPLAIGVEEDIIDEFHATHDHIRVAPVAAGWGGYHDMLLTQLAAGSGPDVMRVDSYFATDYVELGAFRPIDDLIERDEIDLDAYYELGIEENTFDGQMYGLPWATAPLFMLVNLDVFEEAGVEVPDNDWTIDDFARKARALTSEDTYGYTTTTEGLTDILSFVWAKGGTLFNDDKTEFTLDEAPAIEALEFLAELAEEGVLSEDAIMGDADLQTEQFVNNRAAMRMGSVAQVLSTHEAGARFEVLNMPTGERLDTTSVKSNVVGINAASDNVDAAWEFLKFLRGPGERGEQLYSEAQRVAPCTDSTELWDSYADFGDYPSDIEHQINLINETYGRSLPFRTGWMELEDLVMSEVQGVLLGDISAEEAIHGIADEAQSILDER